MASKNDNKELRDLIHTLQSFIFVVTEEEGRFVQWLKDEYATKKRHKIRVWRQSLGMKDVGEYVGLWENYNEGSLRPDATADPNQFLLRLLGENTPMDRTYTVVLGGDNMLNGRDPMMTRRLMDIAEQASMNRQAFKSVIFVGSSMQIPPGMDRYFRVTHFELPDTELHGKILDGILGSDQLVQKLKQNIDLVGVRNAASGMTHYEWEQTILSCLTLHHNLSPEMIRDIKREIIKKNPLLELIPPNVTFDDIGGMSRLKEYLARRKNAWTPEGKSYGLPRFRGVLQVGLPGNGKSLSCKALAHEYGIPLVKFDPAKLFAGQVGASESNMRRALDTLERMSPCVAGDTPILMSDGTMLKAEEIFELAGLGEALDILTVDPDTGEKTPSKVRMITRKRAYTHGVVNVETQGGRVTVRGDHQLWTSKGFKEAKDLEEGDRIRFLYHEYEAGDPLPITNILPEGCRAYLNDDLENVTDCRLRAGRDYHYLHEGNLDLPYIKYGIGRGGYTDSYVTRLPATVTEDLSELVGYIDSEGSWGGRSIQIYNTDQKLLDRCVEICETRFGYTPTQHLRAEVGADIRFADGSKYTTNKDCYVLRIDRSVISQILENLRDDILKWEYAYLLPAYLRAFINGDGHIREAHITVTQSKANIKVRVMEVLRRLGVYVRESDRLNIEITGAGRVARMLDIMSKAPSYEGDKVDSCVWPDTSWTFTRGIHNSTARDAVDVEVKKITHIDNPDYVVYDLSCDAPHTYIGAGMVHHNCVAWIDEIEKGLAGMQSSTFSDSGTTARVIGSFLTWMQECEEDVILMATANDVTNLPPELLRRFDEVFFVGLPRVEQRKEIWDIHIRKVGRDPKNFDIDRLVAASNQRSGAEIEVAVGEALYVAFDNGAREVTTDDMEHAAATKPPIVVTMREQLTMIQEWVGKDEETGDGVRARFAHALETDVAGMEAV